MIWIYSVLCVVLLSIALCFGLVGALIIAPQGTPGVSFYTYVGTIAITIIIVIAVIFYIMKRTGHIKLHKNLTKNF